MLPATMLLSTRWGLQGLAVPWVTAYVGIAAGWLVWTCRVVSVPLRTFVREVTAPLATAAAIVAGTRLLAVSARGRWEPSGVAAKDTG